MNKKKNLISFEDSLKKLEDIVEKLESGEISLNESVSLYEKGVELKRYCEKKLKEVELTIKKIKLRDGKVIKEDFKDN